MSNPSPTNGELAVMIQGLTQEMRDGHREVSATCNEIKQQVSYTNGRVRKLEAWKYAMMGGMILGNLIIVPIIVSFVSRLILKA
jgi:hypothetical protein